MPDPYFSIIVPFYNKERYFNACIKALLNQDFPREKYEIIAVDNNSQDASLAIVNKYPDIRLIHEKKQNPYAARNSGISNSSGSVIVFTDADSQAPKNWLSNIYQIINEKNYDILIGWFTPTRPIRLLQIHGKLVAERIKKAIEENNPRMLTACAANLTIRKEIFKTQGLFLNGSNSEDTYFVRRCFERGYKVGFDDKAKMTMNDLDSIGIFFLKNFIYGCSVRPDGDLLSFPEKVRHASIAIKIIFKYFPVGLGLIPASLCYLSGYLLTHSGILNSQRTAKLIFNYTNFMNKKACNYSQ
ncbi:MAG: glycosyltransferase [Candidatus Omnitrophica bacterium]|nr:glycosyltransferase [Candidatus Omnitrophota bacterium]